jgi:hypothetical protein
VNLGLQVGFESGFKDFQDGRIKVPEVLEGPAWPSVFY